MEIVRPYYLVLFVNICWIYKFIYYNDVLYVDNTSESVAFIE